MRNWIIRTHRWMGVALCAPFLLWFGSGMALIYFPFPHVDDEARLAHADVIDPGRIHIPPAWALGSLHESTAPTQIRLGVLDGRPVYRFEFGGRTRLVFADDGARLDAVPQETALRLAAAWAASPARAASFQGLVTEDDQWTLSTPVQSKGPFWKYGWPDGEEVYVSQRTGDVVQATTRNSRLGAYCGAIPHWLFFARLRRHAQLWSQVVMWLSGAGAATSLLGLAAGIWLYIPSRRIPYTGVKHWHVVLGLFFGAVTFTWVFSGFLSMEPFSWLSQGDHPNLQEKLLAPNLDIAQFAAKEPRQAVQEAGSEVRVKELLFTSFDGQAFYLAV